MGDPRDLKLNRREFLAAAATLSAVGTLPHAEAASTRPVRSYRGTRPGVSANYGLAPETPVVIPAKVAREGGGFVDLSWPLKLDGPVTLDFGRKLTGRVKLEIDGPVDYVYASDLEQLDRIREYAGKPNFHYHEPPTYMRGKPVGRIEPHGGGPVALEDEMSVLRYLQLRPAGTVTLRSVSLEFSPPHLPLAGAFTCDDDELNRFWHFGVYTTLLCTQSNVDALVPVLAPGRGYVIWDGARRDREVWAGDLRQSSLVWLHAYDDPEPVRNSLYILWQGRHIQCSESGMLSASGSTHQTLYSYAFWFLINAWEYYLWTGDRDFLRSLMSPMGLDWTFDWIKRKANPRGLLETADGMANSWMYVYELRGELAELAITQTAGLEALASLFDAGGKADKAKEAREWAARLRKLVPERFFDRRLGAYRMQALDHEGPIHYPLDANVLAAVYRVGDDAVRGACLRFLDSPRLRTPVGLRCLWPPFDEKDGDWAKRFPAWHWVHNTTVWPYPNGYAAQARMLSGDMQGGLDAIKAFCRPIDARGHCTIWEAMMPDGSLPFGPDGNTLSFSHAWGGAGSYLLQRHVLGVAPEAPGFVRMSLRPDLGPLKHAAGAVPTPHGPIRVELEKTTAGLRGELRLPKGIQPLHVAGGVEVAIDG